MRLEIDSEAAQELATAYEWYEVRSVQAEYRLEREIEQALEAIQVFPFCGAPYEKGTRRFILHKFPFAIIYHAGKEQIRIMAIMHLHRHPGYWWQRA